MKQEELEKLYRSWADNKLLDAFNKRYEYSETAVKAMLAILSERKMSHIAEEIFLSDSIANMALTAVSLYS